MARACVVCVVQVSGESSHCEETVCSLRFGEKLASVQTSAALAQPMDVGQQRRQVGAELAAAHARLDKLSKAGQADRINTAAPPSEQTTLRNNLLSLTEREAEVRALKVQLVEARGRASSQVEEAELAAKLEAAQTAHTSLHDLVEMQKGVVGRDGAPLFVPATPAYRRCEAQAAALAAQLKMLGS